MSIFNIVIIGMGAVGKSAIVIKFLRGKFVEDYDPTTEELYRKDIIVDDIPLTVNIIDTAGQEEYASLQDKVFRRGDGFICVYSIIYTASFNDLTRRINHIKMIKDEEDVSFVIIGNKVDMKEIRTIEYVQGQEFAGKNNCKFFETSAKTGENIKKVFDQIIREIRLYKKNKSRRDSSETKIQVKNKCTLL